MAKKKNHTHTAKDQFPPKIRDSANQTQPQHKKMKGHEQTSETNTNGS